MGHVKDHSEPLRRVLASGYSGARVSRPEPAMEEAFRPRISQRLVVTLLSEIEVQSS